ncbi:hypothetical protein RND71_019671 [Anisodus tanguticus]|uniref:TPX2 C-terminal domain-containing protein n=1 Tax=Anisodus tanguticus TaxID=243964 RepID=A0AAE1RXT3_9SOLA|nr:hypothetical protein RND71_019671 [Anisodus tanguticus]
MVCKCNNKAGAEKKKCLCVAYESLRASQEEFFKNRGGNDQDENGIEKLDRDEPVNQEITIPVSISEGELVEFGECCVTDEMVERAKEGVGSGQMSGGTIKRRRERLLEEARQSVPEAGSGKVKHLVRAFEKLLSIPKTKECEEKGEKDGKEEEEDSTKGQKWALPGLQPPKILETQVSSSSFCPSDFFVTSESLGLDSRRASSLDSSHGWTSGGGRRSRRNSAESSGTFAIRKWKRMQLKATSQKPFKLRTEERGKCKEEEFLKKMQQMAEEEEKQWIPIAQGLPWTTDEPECLPKPPVKESTRPVDLVMHSDIRAVERAEFDHQVAEKLSLIEQYKMERERLQKMAEEEEIRRLRKELVPKAQPMPYFDRPFIPRRPRLYVSLKESIVESPNSLVATNSSVAVNLSGAANTAGSASPIIDEDPCQPPMDNDIYEDHCEPLMDNDCPDNVHGDDLENPASNNHSYVDGTCLNV